MHNAVGAGVGRSADACPQGTPSRARSIPSSPFTRPLIRWGTMRESLCALSCLWQSVKAPIAQTAQRVHTLTELAKRL